MLLDDHFKDVDVHHYKQDIEAIKHHWENCIETKGLILYLFFKRQIWYAILF